MITWQDRIGALRTKGLTLAEIGQKIGLTAQSVCDLEAGRSKSPRGDAAVKLDALFRETVLRGKRGRGRA
jgi:transcriptional regulator with XRE-family HTH domain